MRRSPNILALILCLKILHKWSEKCKKLVRKIQRLLRNPPVLLTQASFPGADDSLCPVSHLEFAEDIGDIVAHGVMAQDEACGNLSVAVTLGDQVEDFALAHGQFGKDL